MKKPFLIAIIVAAFGFSYWGQRALDTPVSTSTPSTAIGYQRIVSMAPSITEVLYSLELGDRVAGVTSYCTYPPEAQEKPEVGGLLDPNYEAIMRLEPDLIVLLSIHTDAQIRFNELGLRMLVVDHRTLKGILDSIALIGAHCQVNALADEQLASIHQRMEMVRAKTAGLDTPTVLISAGRTKGTGKLEEVYAAGKGQWYDDLIEIAGGTNVFSEKGIPFPNVTGEALIRLNPEVIVEMTPEDEDSAVSDEAIIADWDALPYIDAVKNQRIYVIRASYATIPGPRFINVVEDLAQVLHPEVDWSAP